ncbi:MAG TPA: hypothetical protein VMJ72_00180 [Candidatus Paceibacterota bacterium]|nr:hypothetical protein [Candidatus Paceibacterota bacterium]
MFLSMFLAAAAITPAQSDAADTVARAYLTRVCASGTEHAGVVTARDGILHEISASPAPTTVSIDDAQFRPLCAHGPLISYHCHPNDDILSLFPGVDFESDANDFGFVAYLEYLCTVEAAQKGFVPPSIEHRLVNTGRHGEIVRFGLRGELLDRARSLAIRMVDASTPPPVTVGPHGVPDIQGLAQMPTRMMAVHAAMSGLYETIKTEYGGQVIRALRRACPNVQTTEELRACTAFTLRDFVATMDPCGSYVIVPPGGSERTCTAARGETIVVGGPAYPGWTTLTPANYDRFTAAGSVVVAYCSETGGVARACSVLLSELDVRLPACNSLKRGYVDTGRHAELVGRHSSGFQEAVLLQDGRRYTITIANASPQMFKLIVCGTDSLFDGMFDR